MKILHDHKGLPVRLTEERLAHIVEHPEMVGLEDEIAKTLAHPERVVQSFADPEARLYYRFYVGTRVGNKYLCVVVKVVAEDAFLLTDKIKRGVLLWPREA